MRSEQELDEWCLRFKESLDEHKQKHEELLNKESFPIPLEFGGTPQEYKQHLLDMLYVKYNVSIKLNYLNCYTFLNHKCCNKILDEYIRVNGN